MPDLTIVTELDNRDFVPGDCIRGHVEWRDVPAGEISAELRLFHYTSGKGTRDIGIIETVNFDAPTGNDRREFDIKLPSGRPSFSGKLVSLTWALELVIDADKEYSERFEFKLSPVGAEIDLYGYADGNAEKFKSGKKPFFQLNYDSD